MTPREKDLATYALLGKFAGTAAIIKYRRDAGTIDLNLLDDLYALVKESHELDAKEVTHEPHS